VAALVSCQQDDDRTSTATCEIHGSELLVQSAYTYSGLPAPQYNDAIQRFLLVGNRSGYPHAREITYQDKRGSVGRYRQVDFTVCPECQRGYNAELARVSAMSEDEFQAELSAKISFEAINIPVLQFDSELEWTDVEQAGAVNRLPATESKSNDD